MMTLNSSKRKLLNDKADLLNIIIGARGAIKRIVIWSSRLDSELERLEYYIRHVNDLDEKLEKLERALNYNDSFEKRKRNNS